jgi:DNA-binding transcriptional regulator YdaS (Cro superfamily)
MKSIKINNNIDAIEKAISYFGTQLIMGDAIGYSQASISEWLRNAKRVPAEAAVILEHVTSRSFTVKQIRPDLFKRKKWTQHQPAAPVK